MFDIPEIYFKLNEEIRLERLHAPGTKRLCPTSIPANLN